MSEFIQRFEGVMEQLKVVRFELEGRLEAALLHRTANLTKQEANNVSSKVDMASNDTDLVSKLKAALRQVGFRKEGNLEVKNEVVLQAETIEEIAPDQGTDDAYYGYQPQNRNRNQQGQQGQQRNQGQGQVLGQGQFGQGQFRQWTQPANNNNQLAHNGMRQRQGYQNQQNFYPQQRQQPQQQQPGNRAITYGVNQILNELTPAQQLQVCGMLSSCITQAQSGKLAIQDPVQNTKRIFQVESNPDDEDNVLINIEQVFVGESWIMKTLS